MTLDKKERLLTESLLLGLIASGVLVAAFGFLAREVLITRATEALDRRATMAMLPLHRPILDGVVFTVTTFASHYFLIPATILVVLVLKRVSHWISAMLFFAAVAGGWLLLVVLKISFHRARPTLWPALVAETTYSFPSGHAMMATVFYGGLAAVVFHLTQKKRSRVLAVLAASAVVVAIASTRVYLGVHWLTDVVAGALVGLFWVCFCLSATEFVAGHFRRRKARLAK